MNKKDKISISYIGDLLYTPPEGILLVARDEDYVNVCYKLSYYRGTTDTNLKIMVRLKNHYSWLRDFTEQIDCPASFEEKTPLLLLAEQWNVDLPDWLTDAEVLAHNLLEIDVESRKTTRFESRYLSHFLGTAFNTDVLNPTDIISVIKDLIDNGAMAAFKEYPLLRRCLKTKCELWAEKSSEPWVREFCAWLPEDFTQVWQWLSVWSALHGYPGKLLEYVLTPEQKLFVRKIPPDVVHHIPLEPTVREQILTQIELFFREIESQVKSSDEFRKIVGMSSGRFIQEYQCVSNLLKNSQFEAAISDIKAVQEKFEFCPGVSKNQLKLLAYCIKPSRPALLESQDVRSPLDWINWTTKEYIPYRAWQIHNNIYDDDLEQTVVYFSDWYISEYASIQKDPDLSLAHCLGDIPSRDPEPNLTIILLVDCLPLPFNEILDDALRNVGFNRHNVSYRFAGLPTVTENNKAALLGGEWQEKKGDYEAILKKRAVSDWSIKNVVYLSNLRSLSEMKDPQEATIVVINLLESDNTLHSDVESINSTYEDELYRIFVRMAEAVYSFSQRWFGSKEFVNVYVVTDHGACRILDEEKRSFDSMVVKKLFDNEKHRFSSTTEDQANEIPQNLWHIGHRFKQPFVSENKIYFIPRGHNTVRNAAAIKGYMHGGATPEEVIVPVAYYKLIKAAWKKPAARFLNLDLMAETGRAKFYVQRMVTLEIEVQNPNPAEISIVRATIMSPDTDLKGCETTTIQAGSSKSITMNCYFKKTALGENPLEIEIVYEIADEHHTLTVTLECDFKSALSGGFNLKDL